MSDQEYAELEELLRNGEARWVISQIAWIGKRVEDRRPEVIAPLLQHPHPGVRSEAIRTLCLYWHLLEYRAAAERMWRDQELDDVYRMTMLMVWASFDRKTKNPDTLRLLAGLLCDRSLGPCLRFGAEDQVYSVSDFDTRTMPGPEQDFDDVDGTIHWARVRAALASAGVEAPPEMPTT